MKRWLERLLACVALGVVVAGCGEDEEEGRGDAQNTQQAAEAGSVGGGGGAKEQSRADGGGGGGNEVSMEGIKFDPARITVSKGDTVTWTNNDTVPHDVTGDDFKSGDAGGMQNGDTFEHTFTKTGTFDYVCTVHPGMKGSVKVQ